MPNLGSPRTSLKAEHLHPPDLANVAVGAFMFLTLLTGTTFITGAVWLGCAGRQQLAEPAAGAEHAAHKMDELQSIRL